MQSVFDFVSNVFLVAPVAAPVALVALVALASGVVVAVRCRARPRQQAIAINVVDAHIRELKQIPHGAGRAEENAEPTAEPDRAGAGLAALGGTLGALAARLPRWQLADDRKTPLAAFGPLRGPDERQQANNALKVYSGKLVERIPRLMRVSRREQIEVRLGTDAIPTTTLAMGLVGTGALIEHNVHVVETMALDLYSPDEGFKIEPLSDREQLITKEALRGTPLAALSDDYGRWMWNVTPLKVGTKKLALRVSARVLDSHGHPTPHTLVPDRTLDIDVRVNKSALAWRGLLWVGGGILAVIFGYFNDAIRQVVWPILQDIFRNVLGINL